MAIKTPRASWTGTLAFGMVNIPIKLGTCFSKNEVSRNLCGEDADGNLVKLTQQYVLPDGTVVPRAEMKRGFALGDGQLVEITDEEWKATEAVQTKSIDIDLFVDLADIDPTLFDSAYHVYPNTGGEKAYRMLQMALADSGKAAVARFVMRSRQYVALIRPRGNLLVATIMVYTDELVDASAVDDEVAKIEVAEREMAMAKQLIEANSGTFDPAAYENQVAKAQQALVEAKVAGVEPKLPAAQPEAEPTNDLLAALEASLAQVK